MLKSLIDRNSTMGKVLRGFRSRLQGLPPMQREGVRAEDLRAVVGRDDPLILEIGCNDGTHTAWLKSVFPRSRIHCFEPEPRAAKRFLENTRALENVSLHQIAMAAEVAETEFYRSSNGDVEGEPTGWDGSGSIRRPTGHLEGFPDLKFDHRLRVPTTTLDAWCAENSIERIDFIWMDVQGAEVDVFNGARAMLPSICSIYTEYSNQELFAGQIKLADIRKMLPMFRVVALYPDDVLLCNRNR